MLKATVLVGNPKRGSRTRAVALSVARRLLPADECEVAVVDLADHAAHVFDWPGAEMSALAEMVAGADLLVVASPTYKATYTGLLKAFLDRLPHLNLRGVVAIPVMTGGGPSPLDGPDTHLRALLVELGATVPTQGLYFVIDDLASLEDVIADWATEVRERLGSHLPRVLDLTL
jgi:FMN reductase